MFDGYYSKKKGEKIEKVYVYSFISPETAHMKFTEQLQISRIVYNRQTPNIPNHG